ncbi:MAG: cytochrome b/b6 domain-containing protein [Armatimonadetes bacterium]|nr:cytochrome b/b6 domain-containing protein [Armatimonadota bacterium]
MEPKDTHQANTPQEASAVASNQLEEKHPLVIRWTHWINFPLMVVLTWSGLLLYWENSNFRVGLGSFTLVKLFPAAFYEALHLNNRNPEGLAWHLSLMWLFTANWLVYLAYLGVSGKWRYIAPNRSTFGRALGVMLHDLHLRKAKPPQGKYNGAQKLAYSAVALMGVLMIVTGFALWKPEKLGWLAVPFGGVDNAKAVHFWLTILFFLYFVVHVAQVVRAGWSNFRSMIVGYELVSNLGGAQPEPSEPLLRRLSLAAGVTAEAQIRERSIRGFVIASVAAAIVVGTLMWVGSQSGDEEVPRPLKWATEGRDEEHERDREREEQGPIHSASRPLRTEESESK